MKANRLFTACVTALSLAACGGGTEYTATLSGTAERPTTVSTKASGEVTVTVSDRIEVKGTFNNLSSNASGAHIYGPVNAEGIGPHLCNLVVQTAPNGTIEAGKGDGSCGDIELSEDQQKLFENGKMYVNVHSVTYGDGEIRGDLVKK